MSVENERAVSLNLLALEGPVRCQAVMKPSLPLFALCLGLSGGAIVGSSCGPAKPVCSPTTCTGCCDGTTGACVQLPSMQACGRNGETCKACSLGFVCSFGSCSSGNNGAGNAGGGFTTSGGSAGGGDAGGTVGGGNVGGGNQGGGNVGGGNVGGGGVGGGNVGGGNLGGGNVAGGTVGGGNVGGGAPICNSTNCSNGCCQGSTCISPPSNANNATCGFAGFGCSDCTATGMVCNSTSFTCVPGSGGGAANPGDSCTNPTTLTLVGGSASTTGSIVGYANDSTQCSGAGPDAVYSVTVPSSGTLQAQVLATGFTPRVNIRSSCTGTPLACDSNPVAGSAQTSTTVAAGTYYVWVDSSAASGSYSLIVTSTGAGGGAAGGSAGGGFAGGVGGGASGSYVLAPITASCDTVSTGTQELAAIADDAATLQATLPIAFTFFGQTKSSYTVSSNGVMQVWSSSGTGTISNMPPATLSATSGAIAPFWDDLDNVTGTDVRSLVLGTGTTRRFVVEWSGWAFYVSGGAGSSDRLRFQVKLFESGTIELHYCSLSGTSTQIDGSSATIGIGDSSVSRAVMHSPSTVSSGLGLRFTP